MPRHLSVYSSRAKLGLIVPPTNTVNEAEWRVLTPDGVTFHTHRTASRAHPRHEPADGAADLASLIAPLITPLALARVDVVAYACTADSMTVPAQVLPERLTRITDTPVVTTAAALIDALKTLDARRISVATPYAAPLNERQSRFFVDHGFTLDRLVGLGIGDSGPADYVRIAETPLQQVRDHVRSAFVHGSDALVVSCTDFPSLTLIEDFEAEFDVPVVTSNQATFWAALRTAGIDDRIPGYGRLLSHH